MRSKQGDVGDQRTVVEKAGHTRITDRAIALAAASGYPHAPSTDITTPRRASQSGALCQMTNADEFMGTVADNTALATAVALHIIDAAHTNSRTAQHIGTSFPYSTMDTGTTPT